VASPLPNDRKDRGKIRTTMDTYQERLPEDMCVMGEAVDALITLDVGGRKVVKLLYPHVRERYGRPLCLMAAEKIYERVSHGDFVLIVCGMLIYPYEDLSETDGPSGGPFWPERSRWGWAPRRWF